jgi:hypothetical protein
VNPNCWLYVLVFHMASPNWETTRSSPVADILGQFWRCS